MAAALQAVCIAAAVLGAAAFAEPKSLPLDTYLNRPEPVFSWFDTGERVKPKLGGGVVHILNVTSLTWLDTTRAVGPTGAVWTHQVAVFIPDNLLYTNVSTVVLTGGCNEGPPKPPAPDEEYLLLSSLIGRATHSITVVVYQLPNCHIVYPSDPSKKHRSEDAMIAWGWRSYVDDENHDPEWLPHLPMTKAAFQGMRAVEQYTASIGIANITGWLVSGASKRGWTTWLVGAGAAGCDACPRVIAIAPLVPIVPSLMADVHQQYQAYGGFTFAFLDYIEAGAHEFLDSPAFAAALEVMDPVNYVARLDLLPKLVVVSSDDEFMQMEWSAGWLDTFRGGEVHLLIPPNSEHSLATGIPSLVPTLGAFVASVVAGEPRAARPTFSWSRDATSGEISVTLPDGLPYTKVVMRHAQTLQTERRDFRWVRLANTSDTAPCSLPGISIPPQEGGGNCVQPVVWTSETLTASAASPLLFKASPPAPRQGHWTGYYVEVFFPSPAALSEYRLTTAGYVWPDTLPFAPCANFTECDIKLL